MDIEDFLDKFYQEFTKTTGAEKKFWKPEQEDLLFQQGEWAVYAVDEDENKTGVGVFYNEADADWACGIHGAFPEFIRRFHEALDEATRLDRERDTQEGRIAELELEIVALKAVVSERDAALESSQNSYADLDESLQGVRQDLALQIDYTKDLEHELAEIKWRVEGLEK